MIVAGHIVHTNNSKMLKKMLSYPLVNMKHDQTEFQTSVNGVKY